MCVGRGREGAISIQCFYFICLYSQFSDDYMILSMQESEVERCGLCSDGVDCTMSCLDCAQMVMTVPSVVIVLCSGGADCTQCCVWIVLRWH